jgi:hypothetical protein
VVYDGHLVALNDLTRVYDKFIKVTLLVAQLV